ncbi:MAG: hypothetical protein C5B49_08200 [Bdellovibrio sp.]|nr:MAG: hypothetical protein C5B49_08200 [Bdellovibrio sp.]
MRPARKFKARKYLLRLIFAAELLAVAVLFVNFDEIDLREELGTIKPDNTSFTLASTTLNGAAEEIVADHWLPETRAISRHVEEHLRFGLNETQMQDAVGAPSLDPEIRLQVADQQHNLPGVQLVNGGRVRIDWSGMTCEYNPANRVLQVRAPLAKRSSVQFERDDNANSSRVSWQMFF